MTHDPQPPACVWRVDYQSETYRGYVWCDSLTEAREFADDREANGYEIMSVTCYAKAAQAAGGAA